MRKAEIEQYSPINPLKNKGSMLTVRPTELESAPMKKILASEESQTSYRVEKTPQPGATRK